MHFRIGDVRSDGYLRRQRTLCVFGGEQFSKAIGTRD